MRRVSLDDSATYQLNYDRIADRTTMPVAGQADSGSAKYQFYETADHKFILFCAIEHKFWDHFCRTIGLPISLPGRTRRYRSTSRAVSWSCGGSSSGSSIRARWTSG